MTDPQLLDPPGTRIAAAVLLAGLLILPPSAAWGQDQTRFDILLHGSLLTYDGSVLKDGGWVAGAYGYLGHGARHALEGAAARTRIDYLDGTHLEQNDLSLAYTHYFPRVSLRAGAHYIDTNEVLTDGGYTLFASVGPYVPYVWNANVEVAYSSYPNYSLGMSVLQIAPGVGLSFGNAEGTRFLYASGRGYYIRLLEELALESGEVLDREFLSAEMKLDYFHGRATVSGYVWSGEQAFAVRQAGFTTYNLPEKHKGGFGGTLKYALGQKVAAAVGAFSEQFRDIGYDEDVSLTVLYLSLGFTL